MEYVNKSMVQPAAWLEIEWAHIRKVQWDLDWQPHLPPCSRGYTSRDAEWPGVLTADYTSEAAADAGDFATVVAANYTAPGGWEITWDFTPPFTAR